MLKIISSNRFKKDLKIAIKRNLNLEELNYVVTKLANQEQLEEKYHDHFLSGNYEDFRECHIAPDWLLIYKVTKTKLILTLSRTGSHDELDLEYKALPSGAFYIAPPYFFQLLAIVTAA